MAMTFEEIVETIRELPPELQQEVGDFTRFLLKKKAQNRIEEEQIPTGKLKLDWRGALSDLRDEYTAVELQHEIQKR